jgi:nucleotide sugar dehydrogenase
MRIGIVGLGVVGSAIKYGFEKLGHEVLCHDLKLRTTIQSIISAEIVFICVPTPPLEDGSCDISNVESVVREIVDQQRFSRDFSQTIAVKSTVTPGTTDYFIRSYGQDNICFVPEFLRERMSLSDFTENHPLCAVGTISDLCFEKICEAHGRYPKRFVQMKPVEAELLKYTHNFFNALRIIFANEMFDVANRLGADWMEIKDALVDTCQIPNAYLDVTSGMRGFRSPCLDKDVPALAALARKLGLEHLRLFDVVMEENDKFPRSALAGMRLGY